MSHLQRLKDIADFVGENATESQMDEFIYQAAHFLKRGDLVKLAEFCVMVDFPVAKEIKERLL